MMEFTFDGLVRYGFGFYNPNHAAALIVAIVPFLLAGYFHYKNLFIRLAFVGVMLFLLVGLALTFSRSGVVVLAVELLLFFILKKGKQWPLLLGAAVVTLLILIATGEIGRFIVDDSVLNRLVIWRSGASLFAANIWCGVGLDNSGLLASSFLLPEGMACRSLINSHLTLLVEFGIFAGVAWLTLIFYALLRGWRKYATWISFLGLCLSMSLSNSLGLNTILDFQSYGDLPLTNFILQWIVALLFIGLMIYLIIGKIQWWKLLGSLLFSAVVIITLLFIATDAPKVRNGVIVQEGGDMVSVLYDESFDLRTIRHFLDSHGYDGFYLPIRPDKYDVEVAQIMLFFGNASEQGTNYPDSVKILVDPPEYYAFPENVEKIFLKHFSNRKFLEREAKKNSIPIEYY